MATAAKIVSGRPPARRVASGTGVQACRAQRSGNSAGVDARPTSRRKRQAAPSPAQTAFYFPQQIDNSRLVKVADPRERRAQTGLVIVAMLLVAATLIAVYPRFALTSTGYRIEKLKREREELLEANRKLRLEEATLRDPRRIDFLARNRLGMVPAAPGQMIALDTLTTDSGPVLARAHTPDPRGLNVTLGNPGQ